jgi:subtilisin family serine protease
MTCARRATRPWRPALRGVGVTFALILGLVLAAPGSADPGGLLPAPPVTPSPPSSAPKTATRALVRFTEDASPRQRAAVAKRLKAQEGERLLGGWQVYIMRKARNETSVQWSLAKLPWVVEAVLDAPLELIAGTPNDTFWSHQWNLPRIGAPEIWNQPFPDQVPVAVTDTGIEITHPDLAGRIWTNPGEVAGTGNDDDGNGFVDDVHGWNVLHGNHLVSAGTTDDDHGTHVAGTIAAVRDNGIGIAGIAPNARVMALRFMGGGQGTVSGGIAAIQYAMDNGARIINASWKSNSSHAPLCDAVAEATRRGILFVAAAGNDKKNIDVDAVVPAACDVPGLLAVAATTQADGLASFSNTGATRVHMGAPGTAIPSTISTAERTGGSGPYTASYGLMDGTSMAAPHVSGVGALLVGRQPGLPPARLAALLANSGEPLAPLGPATLTGRRLDAAAALAWLADPPGDATPPRAFQTHAVTEGGLRPRFSWRTAWDDGLGVAEYRLVVGGTVRATVAGERTRARPVEPLPEGAHSWHVQAVDAAGNVRASGTRTVTITATEGPQHFTLTLPEYVHGDGWTATWSTPQSADPISHYTVLVDGEPMQTLPAGATEFTCTAGREACLPRGSIGTPVTVRAHDVNGLHHSESGTVVRVPAPAGVPAEVSGVDHRPELTWTLEGLPVTVRRFHLQVPGEATQVLGPAARGSQPALPLEVGSHQVALTTEAHDGTLTTRTATVKVLDPPPPPSEDPSSSAPSTTPPPPSAPPPSPPEGHPDQPGAPAPASAPPAPSVPRNGALTPLGASLAAPPASSVRALGALRHRGAFAVRRRVVWFAVDAPAGMTHVAFGRAPGAVGAWRPVGARMRVVLARPGRTVLLARFRGPAGTTRPRPVVLLLDTRAPRLVVRRAGARVRLIARDDLTGVRAMQLRRGARPLGWRAFRPALVPPRASGTWFVRVRDGAGNMSPWRPLG